MWHNKSNMQSVIVTLRLSSGHTTTALVLSIQMSIIMDKNKIQIISRFLLTLKQRKLYNERYFISVLACHILTMSIIATNNKGKEHVICKGRFPRSAGLTEHWSSCLCSPSSSPGTACSSIKKSFAPSIHFSMTFESVYGTL